ncbi:LLM class flavin-dependent oxidoreductase, partial [Staphylococcus capitis]|uniref:LLM class flavin-dependent oxidoreductase n=1 Tax=Staphylococcus capitis TaxID=29388 RepID=UPI0011A4E712
YTLRQHHTKDYPLSDPLTLLPTAAATTHHIKLSSPLTLLSSHHPLTLYHTFSTLHPLSNPPPQIIIPPASFIQSFPLFRYNLNHYQHLFNQKLQIFLKINKHE